MPPSSSIRTSQNRRWLHASFLLLLIASSIFAVRSYTLRTVEEQWPERRSQVRDRQIALINARASEFVLKLDSFSERLLLDSLELLLQPSLPDRRRNAILRAFLQTFSDEEYSCELRNSRDSLIAFSGRPIGICPVKTSRSRYRTIRTTPYTLLVREDSIGNSVDNAGNSVGGMRGTLSISVPLSVSVPLSNRFLHSDGFFERLEETLDMDGRFLPNAVQHGTDGSFTVPFVAANDTVGFFQFPNPDIDYYSQSVAEDFESVLVFLVLMAIFSLSVPFYRWYASLSSLVAKSVTAILHILAARYVLHLLGLGRALLPEAFLRPEYFASTFGEGIANSPGELTLSMITLTLVTMVLYNFVLHHRDSRVPNRLRSIVVLLVFVLLPFVVRGFAATIRSFVLDSSFNYDDVAGFIDQGMQLLMLFNAFLLSLSLGFVFLLGYVLIKRILIPTDSSWNKVFVLAGGIVLALTVFLLTTENLLLPPAVYVLVFVGFTIPILVRIKPLRDRSESLPAPFVFAWVAGTLLTVVLMSVFMDEKRGAEVEAIGIDLARPVDGWSQVLLEQSLQYVQRVDLSRVSDGEREGTYQLAFHIWAASPLSRLQNNSAILLLDSSNSQVSQFAVGNDPFLLSMSTLHGTIQKTEGIVQSTYRQLDTREKRYYKGYTEIPHSPAGRLLAVVILETPDPMQMAGGGVDLLRSKPAAESLAPEDQFIISRFRAGRLVQTSDYRVPRTLRLPDFVHDHFLETDNALWSTLVIDGEQLDTYFIALPESDDEIIAITKGREVLILSLYRWLRTAFIFLLFSSVLLLIAMLVKRKRLQRTTWTFARKLQLSFLAIAAIPLLLIWLTGRQFIADNARRDIEIQVGENLDVLRSNILEQIPDSIGIRGFSTAIDDQVCQEIRLRTGKDINLYRHTDLFATSKPELYNVGLLNARINPAAFLNIVLLGKDLHFAEERIGDFSYYVGYRALRDEYGELSAVISTPTLFEHNRYEQAYVRASAAIFLWITLIAFVVLLASAALAKQISRPLSEFLRATKDITAGNLDRKVRVKGSTEIVDLMGAFNTMTDRLRQSQEELAAAERELAWKEMAKQVAHEIRNPLTPMKLAAQHLQRAYRDRVSNIGEIIEKVTETMIDQINSLSRISDEFSRFARMPKRSTREVRLEDVLRECIALFSHHDHVLFEFRSEDNIPNVIADREELSRAFTNIVRNAVQAIRERGHVLVSAGRDGENVRVSFHDDGGGIPAELLDRIFEPNFSTRTEGMGLGLAIVKKIIDDAHGRITIESTPDEGTTVTLILPAASADS